MQIGLLALLMPQLTAAGAALTGAGQPQGQNADLLAASPFQAIMTKATQALSPEAQLAADAQAAAVIPAKLPVVEAAPLLPETQVLQLLAQAAEAVELPQEQMMAILQGEGQVLLTPEQIDAFVQQLQQLKNNEQWSEADIAALTQEMANAMAQAVQVKPEAAVNVTPVVLVQAAIVAQAETDLHTPVVDAEVETDAETDIALLTIPAAEPVVEVPVEAAVPDAQDESQDVLPFYAETPLPLVIDPLKAATTVGVVVKTASEPMITPEELAALRTVPEKPVPAADQVAWQAAFNTALQSNAASQNAALDQETGFDAAGELPDSELEAVLERLLSRITDGKGQDTAAKLADFTVTNTTATVWQQAAVQPDAASLALDAAVTPDVDVTGDAAPNQVGGTSHPSLLAGQTDAMNSLKGTPAAARQDVPHYTPAEQLRLHIAQALNNGTDRLTIQLDPQDLGRVEVRIEVQQDGRSHITIMAENKDTMDLLQRDARQLERALQEAGLDANASDMQFTLAKQGQDDQWAEQNERGFAGYGEGVGQEEEPATVDSYTGQYTITLNEGVDIKV